MQAGEQKGRRGRGRGRKGERQAPSRMGKTVGRGIVRLRRARRAVHLPGIAPIAPIRRVLERSRAKTAEGLAPEAALHASRNFRMGVLNGIMFTLVEALIAPSIVLAWFLNRLGAPNILVGLLPAILSGGWFLPQLIVASRVQGRARMMPIYRRVGQTRTVCMALLALTTLVFAEQPTLLLITFFIFYSVYSFSAGISGIPWLEIVGKVISPRRRGSFFGQRSFWGGFLALLASAPLAALLSEGLFGLRFPYNFAVLFGITTLVAAVGVWSWSSIREPEATATAPQVTVVQLIKRGIAALKSDRDYRSFMLARILMALATVADPFYVVFATVALDAPPATVGLYLGALSISALLSNFLWGPLADRAGNRLLMVCTILSVSFVPLTALVISQFRGLADKNLLFSVFALVFVLSGLALGAARIVNNNMLLSIAPPAERVTYIGFLNTVLGIAIFVPVLGGALVDVLGFEALFGVSLALTGTALLATTQMSTRHVE